MIWKISPQFQPENQSELLARLRQGAISSLSTIQQIFLPFAMALAVGFLLSWLQVPVGWLLGPMIVGILYAVMQGNPQPLPTIFITLGKAFLGLTTAVRFSPETLSIATTYAIPLLFCILITGSLSLFCGYLLAGWTGLDRTTGLLSFIPGVASTAVAIGEEIGADAIAVAVLQYLRMLLVVFIIPGLANFFFRDHLSLLTPEPITILTSNSSSIPLALNLLILAFCCGAGIWLGKLLRLPASGYLGTFIVGLVVFWASPYSLEMPQWLFTTGLLFVGLSVGVKFDWEAARHLWKAIIIEVGLVVLLSLFCLGVGYGFHLTTGVDTVTAILGFTPGGIEAMIATVMELGGDTGLVLAMQLTRMLLIILLAPWVATTIIQRQKNTDDFSETVMNFSAVDRDASSIEK
ncbi:MAG: AbrB family transcriptional regulator [Cyanobacteriota bacterium]|nr:AbrB family transcriptional regulator [Cyanobacteriota bacterium]